MNEIYNSLSNLLLIVLAVEGIKSVASLYSKPIKGRKALWVFVGLTILVSLVQTGCASQWLYLVMSATQILGAVGGYHFVSRLLKALAARK